MRVIKKCLSVLAFVLATTCCLWVERCEAFVVVVSSSRHVQYSPAVAGRERGVVSNTRLYFGIPSFFTPRDDDTDDEAQDSKTTTKNDENKNKKKNSIGLSGLVQLITAGAGAPFLGDFEGVDEESGKFMFSLEANNLVDENGQSKQTKMPYFENGWVDENDPGFKFPWQK
jgi:hypothetical protein